MIAALFALAAAMIIGGCAAVIQGFPYVRLESGLAMVIAGSVAASSGAVLLGLGVLGLGVRRVAQAIDQIPNLGARDEAILPKAAIPKAVPAAPEEGRTRPPPILPAAPAFIVPSVVEPPFDPERPRIEPDLGLRADPPIPKPVAAELPKPVRAEPIPQPTLPRAPLLPHKDEPSSGDPGLDVPRPLGTVAPEDDLFAAPEPNRGPEAEPVRPAFDPAPDLAPPALKPETRTVVGRYASGGNTYVMFENGSIEAETPQGRFTFASLDELKAFVDGGGEAGTRGAA